MAAEDAGNGERSPFRDREPIPNELAEQILAEGEIDVLGRMPWSSNATMLCDVRFGQHLVQAIYKPARGERPLWDFPTGLFRREVACYRLAGALGWDLVPPTILVDGPVGRGSLQLFIPCDFEHHYLTLNEDSRYRADFERLVAFDVVANSTDRKSGHVLLGADGEIWAIDNGLSFHVDFKLRTVLWDFAGEPIPDAIRHDLLATVKAGLDGPLGDLLAADEIDAAETRARTMIDGGRFPIDPSGRRWPWPLV